MLVVSQAKGLIERYNGTFQGRLVNELRLNGITTIEEANKYLNEVFMPKFNKRFAMDYTKFPSVFEEAPSKEKINYILAVLTPRKIDNGNAIKYHNKYYQPYLDNNIKCFKPKTEVLVIKAFDRQLLVSIDEAIYELRELSRNERFSKEFDEEVVVRELSRNERFSKEFDEEVVVKERKVYIFPPPMSHPWKLESFKRQFRLSHLKHQYA